PSFARPWWSALFAHTARRRSRGSDPARRFSCLNPVAHGTVLPRARPRPLRPLPERLRRWPDVNDEEDLQMRMPWRARSPRSSAAPTAALPRRTLRRRLAIGVVPLLLAGAGWVTAQPAQAAIACRVDYEISASWPGGFTANV